MRRGTTPYVEIGCGRDWSTFKEVEFTIKDKEGNKIIKNIDDFEFESDDDGNTIMYSQITQKESLSLCPDSVKVKVQLRILDELDNSYASPIVAIPLEDVLSNRVLK